MWAQPPVPLNSNTPREVRHSEGILKLFGQSVLQDRALRFRESRGLSQKVSKKSPGPGSQKSEKSLEKSPKRLQKPIFGQFFDFSGLFRDFFRTFGAAAGDFLRNSFETLWLRAPRLLLQGPRNLKPSVDVHAYKLALPLSRQRLDLQEALPRVSATSSKTSDELSVRAPKRAKCGCCGRN